VSRLATITIQEYERAVRFVDGRVHDVLGPGRHRYRPRRTTFQRFDVRSRLVTVLGQEVLTADNVGVRISAVMRTAVADPVVCATASQDAHAEMYAAAQQAMRVAVAGVALEALLSSRTALGPELLAQVQSVAARVGMTVDEVAIRDVMLPGELRRAYGEMVLAREQGRAELERARTEAATLRSLANTARLLEEHPALLRLRTLQLAEQHNTQLRLTLGD
jgi:regulator of protease activity HflC (stomatin/prohibitin superfamily)